MAHGLLFVNSSAAPAAHDPPKWIAARRARRLCSRWRWCYLHRHKPDLNKWRLRRLLRRGRACGRRRAGRGRDNRHAFGL